MRGATACVAWLLVVSALLCGAWGAVARAEESGAAGWRTTYHFQPEKNWMNDPNGPIFFNHHYHLFYQYNPTGALWGNMHWGHAVSRDLINWSFEQIALSPSPDGPDRAGVFSGSAVHVHEQGGEVGTVHAYYTCVSSIEPLAETQCMAEALDTGLRSWRKYENNPVMPSKPHGVNGWRDPFVWKDFDTYYMSIASGIDGLGGQVLLYTSDDGVRWRDVAVDPPLVQGNTTVAADGYSWECSSITPLEGADGLHVIVYSNNSPHFAYRKSRYIVGRFDVDAGTFAPVRWGTVDTGVYYAALPFYDNFNDRYVLWGWSYEQRTDASLEETGWAGIQAIPRHMTACYGDYLCVLPVYEVEGQRQTNTVFSLTAERISAEQPVAPITQSPNAAVDISLSFVVERAGTAGICVLMDVSASEKTCILYESATRTVSVERAHSSLSDAVSDNSTISVQLDEQHIGEREEIELRVLVDHSVVEVFVNGGVRAMTARVYPTLENSVHTSTPFVRDGAIVFVKEFLVWGMAPMGPGRTFSNNHHSSEIWVPLLVGLLLTLSVGGFYLYRWHNQKKVMQMGEEFGHGVDEIRELRGDYETYGEAGGLARPRGLARNTGTGRSDAQRVLLYGNSDDDDDDDDASSLSSMDSAFD